MAQQRKQFVDHTAQNSDPKNGISICIANVHANISAARIKYSMIGFQLGFVERVDVVKTSNPKFNRAYVHFAPGKWNMRDREQGGAYDVLCALQNGKSVKVEYEEGKPWFWKLQISRLPRTQKKRAYGKSDIHLKSNKNSKADEHMKGLSTMYAPLPLTRQETGEIVSDGEGQRTFQQYSEGKHYLTPKSDKHSDANTKQKSSVSYGRAKRNNKPVKEGTVEGFFASLEKKRTYENACKLAYENRKDFPETFAFPEEGAPEGVKRAFTRAVYRQLGM